MDDEMIPFPSEEATPPVTKTYFMVLSLMLFVIVDKCFVQQFHSSRCGVVAAEIPVSWVIGTGLVQSLYALEYQLYRC